MERATREQLKREFIARVFEARSDIVRAVDMLQGLQSVIAAKSQAVDALKSFLQVEKLALNGGNLDIFSFYTAAVSLNQKQIELLKAESDRDHAWVALELAAGVNLDQESSHSSTQEVSP